MKKMEKIDPKYARKLLKMKDKKLADIVNTWHEKDTTTHYSHYLCGVRFMEDLGAKLLRESKSKCSGQFAPTDIFVFECKDGKIFKSIGTIYNEEYFVPVARWALRKYLKIQG